MFAGRELTPEDLVVPWLSAGIFMVAGLIVSFAARPDPKAIGEALRTGAGQVPDERAAPLRELVRRPGVPTALIGSVSSFAVMVGVMNLSGYVAVGRHHHQGDVFTIISVHIVGMYGLILVVGDIVERLGRRRAIVVGLVVMAASNALLWPLEGIAGMSLSLFGLGLGWSLSYVAATAELVELAAPAERGRLIGFNDLLAALAGAILALTGGVLYSATGATLLALAAAVLAIGPAFWVVRAGFRPALEQA